MLENLRPVLHNLDPFLQYTGEYVPELQAFFANLTAASQSSEQNSDLDPAGQGPKLHLLTTMPVLSPESLAIYPSRIGTNRANAYPHPGAYGSLGNGGLPVFSSSSCADSAPAVSGPPNETVSEELLKELISRQRGRIAGRQPTGNPQQDPGPGLHAAGSVHVQRPDQPVPARGLGGRP